MAGGGACTGLLFCTAAPAPPQGRPSYFIDMRIVDDEGRELPHDGRAHGDLQVRGPHVVSHYFRVRWPCGRHAAAGLRPGHDHVHA